MTTLRPDTPAQVQDAVAWAVSEEAPLEIVTLGSKRAVGRPMQTANTLDLSGLAGIGLYEPEELICQAGPGTPVAEIEAALAEQRQMLAFEPIDLGPLLTGEAGQGSIAGVFACNLAGPRRIKAGAARDHLLGFTAVTGRGETVKSGGRVVKNVTGYDLSKIVCGSWGTLAALTDLTFKVLPAPEHETTLVIGGLDEEAAVRAMSAALGSPHEVSSAAHLPIGLGAGDVAGPATCIRLEGFGPSVAARAAALEGELAGFGGSLGAVEGYQSRDLWRALRDVEPLAAPFERPVWRLSLPPMAGPAVVLAIRSAVEGADYYYDWAGGLVWLAVPPAPDAHAGTVRGAVAGAASGHATLVRADEAVRAAAAPFPPQDPGVAALSARIKASFDPLGILNPGRMMAGV
ncbi:MAG: FAD-binding protein [Thalassobaculum sp.]|uniref:FAD-binding protein n=1 Tax=Thalassobaculum sp. TaxID=2022740 RepID=UPI0032EDC7FD